MMAPAAGELGVRLRALVEAADGATAQVVVDSHVGVASDDEAIRALITPSAFGRDDADADVLTFEHEHVPGDLLRDIIDHGIPVNPGPDALVYAQNKIAMRQAMERLGLPNPRWAALPVDPVEAGRVLDAFIAEAPVGPDGSREVVVKTSRGGYDGKGVRVVSSADQVADWMAAAAAPPAHAAGSLAPTSGVQLLVEDKVPFTRELAVQVARRPSGDMRVWPVVESIQRGGVCSEVIAPAPGLTEAEGVEIGRIATRVAEGLDVTGVLAVELFEAPGPGGEPVVYVNELAMRPHNSGHWTIDGAVTSQFEQHLRAVLDWPLGATDAKAPWTVMANVLGSTLTDLTDALPQLMERFPEAKVNLYGKGIRAGRKLGHVNVSGDNLETVRQRAMDAAALLRGEKIGDTP
jgi:5-(carboxyamino)imidazole ribonucleotide synthase